MSTERGQDIKKGFTFICTYRLFHKEDVNVSKYEKLRREISKIFETAVISEQQPQKKNSPRSITQELQTRKIPWKIMQDCDCF